MLNPPPISGGRHRRRTRADLSLWGVVALLAAGAAAYPIHAAAQSSIKLGVSPSTVAEGDGPTTVAVTATVVPAGVVQAAVDVDVTVAGSGDAQAVDFAAVPKFVITIPAGAGSASGSFQLQPVDDGLDENAETLSVSGTSTLSVTSTQLKLDDDDPLPTVTLSYARNYWPNEAQTADFLVSLDKASGRAVEVGYFSVDTGKAGKEPIWEIDRYAAPGKDFDAVMGRLTFAPGETSQAIVLTLRDDTIDEPLFERLVMAIHKFVNADVRDGAVISPLCADWDRCSRRDQTCYACAGITDNDPTPELTLDDAQAVESAGIIRFPLRYSAPTEKWTQLKVTTLGQTAQAHKDFREQINRHFTFRSTGTEHTVPVDILNDRLIEDDETFEVRLLVLHGPDIKDGYAIGTILDDDRPNLSVAGVSAAEGSTLDFQVSTSSTIGQMITVDYKTSDGTAVSGQDYQAAQGTLTLAAGQSSRKISVSTIDDTLEEQAETLVLTLSSPTNAILTAASADGTILANDTRQLSVAGASGTEGGALDFVVSASLASVYTMQVNYQTSDGTAVSGQDYQAAQGTLTFAPGELSKTVSVSTLNDALDESAEKFTLTLSSPVNADLAVASADGTILDDDAPAQLSVADASGDEGSALGFVVSLSPLSGQTVSVNYATANGTAVSGKDYQAAQGTLTFAPGETSRTVSVTALDDTQDEPAETFALNLSSPANATLNAASASGTILDTDATPRLSVADASGDEGGSLAFVVSTPTSSVSEITVNYATANGTAVSGQDYQAAQGTLTFAPGETSGTISVSTVDDTLEETVETFALALSSPANASLGDAGAAGTILDDDTVQLSVSGFSGTEGNAVKFLVMTVRHRSGLTMSVDYATRDGTAVAGQDYQAAQGTLTFAPGEWYKEVPVSTLDDTRVEGAEKFALVLSAPVNARLRVASADGTILDNDVAPELSVADASGSEGSAVDFVVSVSSTSADTITVNYATANGTAVSGQDYQAAQGTLTFAPGATSGTVSVATVDDALYEPAETFTLTLSLPQNVTLGDSSANGEIVDDDAPPQLSIAGASVVEGGTAAFVVSASATSGQTVTVNYATADGTAVSGEDYQATQGTLTFAPGATSATVSVATVDDVLDEPAETFALTLSSPANATLGTASADGEIADDDAGPELSVAGGSVAEGSAVEFVVSVSSASGQTVMVNYATADDTAVVGEDYQAAQGSLTFAPGETSRTVTVATLDDALRERAEVFALVLSSPANATLDVSSAEGWILDDDSGPQLSVAGASGTEGDAVAFVVSASSTGGQTIMVDYATTDGNAVAGQDYRAARGTLTFAPEETRKTVLVATLDDALDEGVETFVLTLSSATHVEFGARTAAGTIIDNDAARVVLTVSPASVAEGAGPTSVRVTATLDGALRDAATVVRVSVVGGSAQEAVDFAAVPDFEIEIAAEAASGTGTFTLSPVDDDQEEADETLTVSGVSGLAVDAATLSLQDDDQRPLETFRVLLFEAAANPLRQGFLRVINNSPTSGEVIIEATDDSGDRREPVSLFIEQGHAAHFNSIDLEEGNPAKRLSGGVGAPVRGDWRLKMSTTLDVDVLAYSRTKDSQARTVNAFVTAMNEVAPVVDGTHRVAFFNPGANHAQQSMLRLINTGLDDVEATVDGIDDAGQASGTVRVSVPGLETVTLTAEELETGVAAGIVEGRLGLGTGKWRLSISANPALVAKALLLSVDKLTNLSSSRDVRTVPVFPSMSEPDWTGLLRVVNRSPEPGEVTIAATDETGRAYEPLTFTLGARAATHVISADLELGNPGKGLAGSTGAGSGNWRLEVDSPLDVYAVAYARSSDGFLTSIHDLVPEVNGIHRANFFNPASNGKQVSWLHLISDSDTDAVVTVTGRDDRGNSPGSAVRLQVMAGTAVMLPSAALESGGHDLIESGALGDGAGKWRLEVTSDQPLKVMSLLVSPTGHLSNVSTSIDPFDAGD